MNNEVVIHNLDGEVMEGSFTSLYFWRDGEWVTPKLDSGGCEATVRRWLVDKGLVREATVFVQDVKIGERVLMSNSVRGVWGGWVVGGAGSRVHEG